MRVRYVLLLGVLLLFVPSAGADDKTNVDQSQFPPTYVPSGEHLYRQFCAACHGADAAGHGPAADSLKRRSAETATSSPRSGWASSPRAQDE
jgi:mono/diheme cytochrome c family protein